MSEVTIKQANGNDADIVKNLVNQMYGFEYEIRQISEISQAIRNRTEFYVFAYINEQIAGFAGASINNDYYKDVITPDIAVIDYIYVTENNTNVSTSFHLISELINSLIKNGVRQAIMQVQTHNKQRFLHYALSNKNIIKSTKIESKGKIFEDLILLIDDLNAVSNLSMMDIMRRAYSFKTADLNEDTNTPN